MEAYVKRRGEIQNTDHVAVDIMHKNDLVYSIKEKLGRISMLHSVCRVPEDLVKRNHEKYFPSLLSIGPLHHGKYNLKVMEDHKWQYFDTLLNRKPNADEILDTCVKTLRHSEQKARQFYGETVKDMGSDKFIEIMLVDGCFIIELLLECSFRNLRRRDDTIFYSTKMSQLRCDMILLENQFPFWVLQQLFLIVVSPKLCNHMSLIELAFYFFSKLIPGDGNMLPFQDKYFGPEIHHFLDLIRQNYLPKSMPPEMRPGGTLKPLCSATQLQVAGITLRRAPVKGPLNIKFVKGELQIPPLEIHRHTETLFRNLIALEYCHPECSKTITSYIFFMESLIQSKDDARVLHRRRILINGSPDREGEIVNLLKNLQVPIETKDFYYLEICRQVNEHQRSRRETCWQNMKHAYHKTELGVVGFILVLVLLVFLFSGIFFLLVAFLLHHFQ